jgi:hypothetical protein
MGTWKEWITTNSTNSRCNLVLQDHRLLLTSSSMDFTSIVSTNIAKPTSLALPSPPSSRCPWSSTCWGWVHWDLTLPPVREFWHWPTIKLTESKTKRAFVYLLELGVSSCGTLKFISLTHTRNTCWLEIPTHIESDLFLWTIITITSAMHPV